LKEGAQTQSIDYERDLPSYIFIKNFPLINKNVWYSTRKTWGGEEIMA